MLSLLHFFPVSRRADGPGSKCFRTLVNYGHVSDVEDEDLGFYGTGVSDIVSDTSTAMRQEGVISGPGVLNEYNSLTVSQSDFVVPDDVVLMEDGDPQYLVDGVNMWVGPSGELTPDQQRIVDKYNDTDPVPPVD